MSADPKPSDDQPPSPTTAPLGETLELHGSIRPRKFPPHRPEEAGLAPVAQAPAMSEEQIRSLSAQLQALLGHAPGAVISPAAAPPPSAAPAEPAAVTAKNRRFSSKASSLPLTKAPLPAAFETEGQAPDMEAFFEHDPLVETKTAAHTTTAAAVVERPPAAPAKKAPAKDDQPPVEAFAELRRQRREQENRRRTRNLALIALATGGICFLLGRFTVAVQPLPVAGGAASPGGSTLPPGTPASWPANALAQLNGILAADQAGRIDDAYNAAIALQSAAGSLPGLDLYIGNLTARRGRNHDASATLSLAAGRNPSPGIAAAATYDQMGFVSSRLREFGQAGNCFSEAVLNDPFRGEYYYHWAEVLRRQGRQAEAVVVFQQALTRLPAGVEDETLRECVALKLRLAQIELGQSSQFLKDMAEGLQAAPGAAGYWELTAAALALQEGRLPEAAAALQKAKADLPAAQYNGLASDYFFRAFASQAQLAGILPVSGPDQVLARKRGVEYFIDP